LIEGLNGVFGILDGVRDGIWVWIGFVGGFSGMGDGGFWILFVKGYEVGKWE